MMTPAFAFHHTQLYNEKNTIEDLCCLCPSFADFLQDRFIGNFSIIRSLNFCTDAIECAFNRLFRRCVNHLTLYRSCIGRPSANPISMDHILDSLRVETDLVSLPLITLAKFEIINCITTVILWKFLISLEHSCL